MDVIPFTQNGRTFLPVRYVAEAIGVPPDNISYQLVPGRYNYLGQRGQGCPVNGGKQCNAG